MGGWQGTVHSIDAEYQILMFSFNIEGQVEIVAVCDNSGSCACLRHSFSLPACSAAAQSNWGSARQKAFQATVPTMYIAAVARKMREKLPVRSSTSPHTARHRRWEDTPHVGGQDESNL